MRRSRIVSLVVAAICLSGAACSEQESPSAVVAKTDAAALDGQGDALGGDSAGSLDGDVASDGASGSDGVGETLDAAAVETDADTNDTAKPDTAKPDTAKPDSGPSCGDGNCNPPSETAINCPKDCAGGANCGDGQCLGAQENAFSCPKDCSVGTGDLISCIMGKCTAEVVQCLQSEPCTEALGCLQGCGSDFACIGQCGAKLDPGTQQILGGTVLCGQQQGCFGVGGSGGQCGDGSCTAPVENPWTCEKDCPKPSCGDGKCGKPWESFLTCKGDCPAPKCGDGNCEEPLESALTCAQDCKPATCGNGKCDAPTETAANCFQDCAATTGTAAACLASKCGSEGLSCATDMKCLQASICAGKCTDKACFVECGKTLPAGSGKLYSAYQDCAVAKSCVGP